MGRTTLKQIEELRKNWKYHEALAEVAGYLKKRPKSKGALELLAQIFVDLNDTKGVYEIMDILTELYPNNGGYWGQKTWSAAAMENIDYAIKSTLDYMKIAENGKKISPEDEYDNYFNLLLETLIEKKYYNQAEELIETLQKMYERSEYARSKVSFNYAYLCHETGLLKQAIEKTESIINTYPEQWFIYWNLSLSYWESGKRKKALSILHEGIEKHDKWKYYGRIARIYLDQDKVDDALKYLNIALDKEDVGTNESISELLDFTDDFVNKGLYNEIVLFLIRMREKYSKSILVLELLVNSFFIFYSVLDDILKKQSKNYIQEYQMQTIDKKDNERHINVIANIANGIIKIEEGKREEGWSLLKKAHELENNDFDPIKYMIDYSKNNKEYLKIINHLHTYLDTIKIGYDYNETLIDKLDILINKIATTPIKAMAESVKLRYSNQVLTNQNTWFEAREIYYHFMRGVVHESLPTIRKRAVD